MKQIQMIEMVKKHHPELSNVEIRMYLDKALDEFCEQTRILKGNSTFTTTADTRYYSLTDFDSDGDNTDQHEFIDVDRVDFDSYQIPKLQDAPEKYSSS